MSVLVVKCLELSTKNVLKGYKNYCVLLSCKRDCSFWSFPPLPRSQVSVSEFVTGLKILISVAQVLTVTLAEAIC